MNVTSFGNMVFADITYYEFTLDQQAQNAMVLTRRSCEDTNKQTEECHMKLETELGVECQGLLAPSWTGAGTRLPLEPPEEANSDCTLFQTPASRTVREYISAVFSHTAGGYFFGSHSKVTQPSSF